MDSEDEATDDEQFPYSYNILPSSHSQAVTALAFYGSDLLSGSRDRHVSASKLIYPVKKPDTLILFLRIIKGLREGPNVGAEVEK